MTTYLVGEPKTPLFGKTRTWDLEQVLSLVIDGDELIFEPGFSPAISRLQITKSITISGSLGQGDQGGSVFTNVIDGIFVSAGSVVTLKDIAIVRNGGQKNCLTVKNNSLVYCDNVYFALHNTEDNTYPIIYVEDNSNLKLSNSQIESSDSFDDDYQIYSLDSTVEIDHSTINATLFVTNTELTLRDSQVSFAAGCAIYANNGSSINFINSSATGGYVFEDGSYYPCVKIVDSKLTVDNSSIFQKNFHSALNLNNTEANLNSGFFDSIRTKEAIVNIKNIRVGESLQVRDNSKVTADEIFIDGRDNGKINLYITNNSEFKANLVTFGLLTSPNTKIENNVTNEISRMVQLKYNQQTEEFVLDDDNNFTIVQELEEIENFGKKNAYQQLNDMIGIPSVKNDIEEFIAISLMNKKREEQNLGSSNLTLHSLFLGNPGTGKTTVARIVGELLYEKGIIRTNNFVETSRSDLVGEYIGHTAVKTRSVLESALGGVLFVDEAYTLANGGEKDFGKEAIDEILKFMEDHRSDIVIIFAGYTDSMQKFLAMNEGLKSRIPNEFIFEDYTEDELVQIGLIDLHHNNYNVDENAYAQLVKHNYSISDDKSNGRWVRNLNEKLLRKVAIRLMKEPNADLSEITVADLEATML